MKPALRSLLSGIIDYAGIFPPAKLPLDEAIRNYAAYRRCDERWMLGRFICPAGRLVELDAIGAELFADAPPFSFSVVGRPSDDEAAFLAAFDEDLAAIERFGDTHGDRVVVDAFEVRLPAESAIARAEDAERTGAFLTRVAEAVDRAGPPALTLFYEGVLDDAWRDAIPAVVSALADHAETHAMAYERYRGAGYKVRTGGVEASAFPSSEQVATVIDACRRADLPFKATAGLHHPLRHDAPSVGTKMHGFLNVFGAAALAARHSLDVDGLVEILDDEFASNFKVSDERFAWRHLGVSLDTIEDVRDGLALSYGSCSFDEPRDDLRALGLL